MDCSFFSELFLSSLKSDFAVLYGTSLCAQIDESFVDIQRKVEMDVKKELAANHESVVKNMDKVALGWSVV